MNSNLLLKFSDLKPLSALLALILMVVIVYWPALQGGFIFDDYPNLEPMGAYGGIVDFETFKNFVFNGFSGPLGRPVSLASFLIDDNKWPTSPDSFKQTNLKIHLLTGLVLIWLTINLLRLYTAKVNDSQIVWVALINGAIWMLHPYMVSTSMYVIQRMAQLAALFVFAGIAGYLHGRIQLQAGRVRAGYLWMTLSTGILGTLAVLSKENGILLPLLIGVIEFCLPSDLRTINKWWRIIFIWMPSVGIFYILGREINFADDAWPNRLFTQPERLLTEGRILIEYLYNLYIPKIEGRGLFQDGYNFSRGLFSPISTAISWLMIILMLVFGLLLRRKMPFFCLGILFFFAGHLIESTVVGLELYFEHRNYLPSAFLFLGISFFLVSLAHRVSVGVSVIGALSLIMVLSLLTWERAKLWSNTEQLQLYWAASTPESARARVSVSLSLFASGDSSGALKYLSDAAVAMPNNSFITLSSLLIKLRDGTLSKTDFEAAADKISTQDFDTQALVSLRYLIWELLENDKSKELLPSLLNLFKVVEKNDSFSKVWVFVKIAPYLKGQLYLGLGDYDSAYNEFKKAIELYNDVDASLRVVAEMANAGRPAEAIMLLTLAEYVFQRQPDGTLIRSKEIYTREINRLKQVLLDDLQSLGVKIEGSKTE
jgi:tetratricopeptide (TPR) repeat protein